MRTLLLMTGLLMLGSGQADAAAGRRDTRCCIMVPADDGSERPYCFNIDARPARRGRRLCRLIGGEPQRPVAR